jgi:hypothetical protein
LEKNNGQKDGAIRTQRSSAYGSVRSWSHRRRIVIAIILIGITVAAAIEIIARSYLTSRFHGRDPWSFYYPLLPALNRIDHRNDTVKIGVFGSSVTATATITERIQSQIRSDVRVPIRVYNLSYIGGTIQDAYYLYKWAKQQRFWGIVVYQVAGELRMNRYLDRVDADYANLSWFRRRRDVDRFYCPWYQTPCAVAHLITTFREKRGQLYARWNMNDGDFTHADSTTRNVGMHAFMETYRKIINIARERQERVFGLSAAYSDPLRQADFARLAGEYSDSIRSLMHSNGMPFVDISELTNNSELFTNYYHLTAAGQERFCAIVSRAIVREYYRMHYASARSKVF